MIVNLHFKTFVFIVKTKSHTITVEKLKVIFREGLQKNLLVFEKKIGQGIKDSINFLLRDSVTYKLFSKKEYLEEWKDEVVLKDLNFPKENDQSVKTFVLDFDLVAIHNVPKNKESPENPFNIEEFIAKATGATCELKSPVKKTSTDEFGGELDDMMLLSTILNLNSGNDNSSRREFLTRIISSMGSGGNNNNPLASLFTRESGTSPNSASLRIPIRPVNVEPNQDLVNQLIEMGFPEDRSRRSLIMTRNNIEAAVELIANDQDLDISQPSSQLQSNNNIVEINQSQDAEEDDNN